jgi:hypothetical protein
LLLVHLKKRRAKGFGYAGAEVSGAIGATAVFDGEAA